MYTLPYISYEIIRERLLFGNMNFLKIIKQSAIVLGTLGPIYAAVAAYYLYVPKEIYWEKLSKKRNNLLTAKIFDDKNNDIDPMKAKKPKKRLSLEVSKQEKQER